MEVVVAIIGAAASICASIITVVSVVITSNKNNASVNAKLDKQQAVMETKLTELASEVHEHNNFARRMPVVEQKVTDIERRVACIERRMQT